tara:strand:- start:53 stop:598 length:546 start_codon:yes stop_codon:yes gene_type:complete
MDNINEAPVVAAATKVVAGLAKAGAKAAAKGGKVAAKSSKNISKAASKFKRPNIKSYKNKETGQVDMDRYRSDQAKYKQIKKDQASRTDMSDTKPEGPSDDRTKRGERKLKAIDKLTGKKKEAVKKGLQKTGDAANAVGDVAKKAGSVAKKSTSAVSGAFGTSSFNKESKITFQQFIDKTP